MSPPRLTTGHLTTRTRARPVPHHFEAACWLSLSALRADGLCLRLTRSRQRFTDRCSEPSAERRPGDTSRGPAHALIERAAHLCMRIAAPDVMPEESSSPSPSIFSSPPPSSRLPVLPVSILPAQDDVDVIDLTDDDVRDSSKDEVDPAILHRPARTSARPAEPSWWLYQRAVQQWGQGFLDLSPEDQRATQQLIAETYQPQHPQHGLHEEKHKEGEEPPRKRQAMMPQPPHIPAAGTFLQLLMSNGSTSAPKPALQPPSQPFTPSRSLVQPSAVPPSASFSSRPSSSSQAGPVPMVVEMKKPPPPPLPLHGSFSHPTFAYLVQHSAAGRHSFSHMLRSAPSLAPSDPNPSSTSSSPSGPPPVSAHAGTDGDILSPSPSPSSRPLRSTPQKEAEQELQDARQLWLSLYRQHPAVRKHLAATPPAAASPLSSRAQPVEYSQCCVCLRGLPIASFRVDERWVASGLRLSFDLPPSLAHLRLSLPDGSYNCVLCPRCHRQKAWLPTLARCCRCNATSSEHHPLPSHLQRVHGSAEVDGDAGARVCTTCLASSPPPVAQLPPPPKRSRSSSSDTASLPADPVLPPATGEGEEEDQQERGVAAQLDALRSYAAGLYSLTPHDYLTLQRGVEEVHAAWQRAEEARQLVEGGRDTGTGTLGGPCSVCLDAQCDALLQPCSHVSCCTACAKSLKAKKMSCPRCSCRITRVLAIHR